MAVYRGLSADAWTAVELEPFTAVYHRMSGTTHLLAEPAPQLLALIGGETMALDAVRARLLAAFDLPDVTEQALEARLDELVEAGLLAST